MDAGLDAVSYRNGQKNHWRRNAWNHIADLCHDKRNAIVLYLPGSTDLDAPEAIRRGFKAANLIAIERNARVVRQLRDRGRTCICAGLTEVMAAWPDNHAVSVVVADFQCGLSRDVINTMTLWHQYPAFRNAVLLLNLQRGREIGAVWQVASCIAEKADTSGLSQRIPPNHRGLLAVASYVAMYADDGKGWVDVGFAEFILSKMVHRFPPTYRSARVLMDSIVLKDTFPIDRSFSEAPKPVDHLRHREIRSKIAAALAIRTRRLRGELCAAS